jgi:hypothetical protein
MMQGRGWNKEEQKNICGMPIGAVDVLNFRLTIFTTLILIATFFLLFITILQICN